jgi:hypothetical protein
MTARQRATPSVNALRLAVAGAIVFGGALTVAGHAAADPEVPYPTPVPVAPGDVVPPGQPVVVPVDGPAALPAPPPVGAPPVPEMPNPVYGQGQSSGPLGSLRDIWHQAQDPSALTGGLDQTAMGPAVPPPGAGAPPQLPPGYISLNAPESNGPPPTNSYAGGPPLPAGYYPLSGPPPPGYYDQLTPIDPSAPILPPP